MPPPPPGDVAGEGRQQHMDQCKGRELSRLQAGVIGTASAQGSLGALELTRTGADGLSSLDTLRGRAELVG